MPLDWLVLAVWQPGREVQVRVGEQRVDFGVVLHDQRLVVLLPLPSDGITVP